MALKEFAFPKLRTLKTWLHKCLKSAVLEEPSTSNIVKGAKFRRNLHDSTFIIFTDHFEANWVVESVSWLYAKC